jgi:hypothetical protein
MGEGSPGLFLATLIFAVPPQADLSPRRPTFPPAGRPFLLRPKVCRPNGPEEPSLGHSEATPQECDPKQIMTCHSALPNRHALHPLTTLLFAVPPQAEGLSAQRARGTQPGAQRSDAPGASPQKTLTCHSALPTCHALRLSPTPASVAHACICRPPSSSPFPRRPAFRLQAGLSPSGRRSVGPTGQRSPAWGTAKRRPRNATPKKP